jgi:hypothetical protein
MPCAAIDLWVTVEAAELQDLCCRIAFGRQERAEQLEKEFEHSAEVEKQLGVLYNSHDALKAHSVNSWEEMASASNVWTVVLYMTKVVAHDGNEHARNHAQLGHHGQKQGVVLLWAAWQ